MWPSTGLLFILSLSLSLAVNAGPLKDGEDAIPLKYLPGTPLKYVLHAVSLLATREPNCR